MLAALLFLAACALGGALVTYLYDEDAPFGVRVALGAVTGSVVAGLIGYALALRWGLSPLTVWLSALPLLSPLVLLRFPAVRGKVRRDLKRAARPRLRGSPRRWAYRAAFALAALFLAALFRGAFYEDAGDGGLWTTNHHNIGDLPWHVAIVQGFAVGGNYPPQHPEFAGTRLTYPFLVDFIAAQYVALGASLTQAFLVQNLALALSLLLLLHRFALRLTRSPFVLAALPSVFLLSGGWAWLTVFGEARGAGASVLDMVLNPRHDYTTGMDGVRWGNMLTTLLVTQRGLLIAVPLALAVFLLLFRAQGVPPPGRRVVGLAWAGGLTGLVPLSHGHTFLSLLLVAGGLALLDLRDLRRAARPLSAWFRDWAAFFAPALLLAAPQALTMASGTGVKPGTFFGLQAGWDSGADGLPGWLLFWLWNTGPLVPLALAAWYWPTRGGRKPLVSDRLRRFYLPFLLLFLLPNVFRFAPWVWDNIKILLYWFLGTVPLAALAVARLWRRGGLIGGAAAALLLVLLVLAGGMDAARVARGQFKQPVFDRDGRAFARLVRENTPPGALLLHAPAYNHPALLSGRRLLSGYTGHLWSHGLDFEGRAADARRIYAGGPEADALLARYGVDYIVLGPPERREEGFAPSDGYLSRFPVVAQAGPYRLLRAR